VPESPSRSSTIAGLAGHALVWSIGVSAVAGAVAGTAVFPVLGTATGLYLGAIYGPLPAIVGAAFVVLAVWAQWPVAERRAVFRSLLVALYLYGLVLEAIVWALFRTSRFERLDVLDQWLVLLWLAVVLLLLLPWVARRLSHTYLRLAVRS
jgi:hypothetical protein